MLTCLDRTIAELEDVVTKIQSMTQSDQLQEYPAVLKCSVLSLSRITLHDSKPHTRPQ